MFRKSLSKWGPTFTAAVVSSRRTSSTLRQLHLRPALPAPSRAFFNYHLHTSTRYLSTQTTTRPDGSSDKRGGGDERTGDGTGLLSGHSETETDEKENEDIKEAKEEEEYWSDEDDGWEEEEDDAEAKIGDGGHGGGVVLGGFDWGQRAFSIANEVLDLHFNTKVMKMFAFKVSPKGYIRVRLDKLTDKYGWPSMEEFQLFNRLYKDKLEESGKCGELPNNLAIEASLHYVVLKLMVTSPTLLRLLNVPDELERFKDIPLLVTYLEEDPETNASQVKDGIFLLDSMDAVAGQCTWKLADVKGNMDPSQKGRPLSKKKREWRLTHPFDMIKRVTFYVRV